MKKKIKVPIIGEIIADEKHGNKLIYTCAECKEDCNTVYCLEGRWLCYECFKKLKNEK